MNLFSGSIKKMIIIISLTFSLMITFIVATSTYYAFDSLLTKSLVQSTSYNLQIAGESISKNLLPISTLANWAQTNSRFSQFIEAATASDKAKENYILHPTQRFQTLYDDSKSDLRIQSLESYNRLLEEFRNNRSNLYIDRVIIGYQGEDYLQIAPGTNYDNVDVAATVKSSDWFQTQIESPYPIFTGFYSSPLSIDNNTLLLPIVRPIYKAYGSETIGWIFIGVSSQLITDAFSNWDFTGDSHLYITLRGTTYEIQNNALTLVENQALTDHILSNRTGQLSELDHNIRQVTVTSSTNDLRLTQTLDSNRYDAQRFIYYKLIIIISMILIILGIMLTLLLNHLITGPIDQLRSKLELIGKGDFSHDPGIEWPNELGQIGQGINELSKNMVTLMEKRIEDAKIKTDLEYQILQSQINPHFLYNTLNSIKWMASIQNATGIEEMTTALARLMRSVSKENDALHTLKDEIELLDQYFIIQKFRYGGIINLTYEIEDKELLSCIVPRFSLQPIVENAIFHGIEPKGTRGIITVRVKQIEQLLHIEIEDNGVGMIPQQLEHLLDENQDTKHDFFKKIGIHNVHQRLKYDYGPTFGIQVESLQGVGSKMTLVMPVTF